MGLFADKPTLPLTCGKGPERPTRLFMLPTCVSIKRLARYKDPSIEWKEYEGRSFSWNTCTVPTVSWAWIKHSLTGKKYSKRKSKWGSWITSTSRTTSWSSNNSTSRLEEWVMTGEKRWNSCYLSWSSGKWDVKGDSLPTKYRWMR